jgi:NitT/TauT family transport system substrate-binding protein
VAPPPTAHLVLQLSDARQAQFAGYYVAQARGYFRAEHLDVTIRQAPPAADGTPPQPGADIYSAWLRPALAAGQGLDLTNIAQVFLHSGLVLICRRSSGIRSPADFRGHRFGVWPAIAGPAVDAWLRRIGDAAVTIVPVQFQPGLPGIAPLLREQVDCLTGLDYEQYWDLIAAGADRDALTVFQFGDQGLAPLQDGLWVPGETLADPARTEIDARFLRASLRGWHFAITHQPETVSIILAGQNASAAETLRQTRMLRTVARLVQANLQKMFYLEPAAYDRALQLLPPGDWPQHAWTHAIWNRATGG